MEDRLESFIPGRPGSFLGPQLSGKQTVYVCCVFVWGFGIFPGRRVFGHEDHCTYLHCSLWCGFEAFGFGTAWLDLEFLVSWGEKSPAQVMFLKIFLLQCFYIVLCWFSLCDLKDCSSTEIAQEMPISAGGIQDVCLISVTLSKR